MMRGYDRNEEEGKTRNAVGVFDDARLRLLCDGH